MTPIETPTRFGLVRHAPTAWNQAKRIQGQEDSPLTPEGGKRAEAWGKLLSRFSWDRIMTSDLGRASATADLINQGLNVPVFRETRLREQDWGQWTGKTVSHVEAAYGEVPDHQKLTGWGFCPPGGESRARVRERSCQALADAAGTWPGETILVVTHEGVIRCLVYGLLGRQYLPTEPRLFTSRALHWLRFDERGLGIEEVNAFKLD